MDTAVDSIVTGLLLIVDQLTFGSNRNQPNSFALNKLESFIDVRQLVNAHFAAVWLRQLLTGDDLKQQHQLESVTKIFFDVFNLRSGLPQM